jgi:hypothetical protein
VWIPNPAWSPTPDLPAGNLALACAAHGAVIQFVRLDHLPPQVLPHQARQAPPPPAAAAQKKWRG